MLHLNEELFSFLIVVGPDTFWNISTPIFLHLSIKVSVPIIWPVLQVQVDSPMCEVKALVTPDTSVEVGLEHERADLDLIRARARSSPNCEHGIILTDFLSELVIPHAALTIAREGFFRVKVVFEIALEFDLVGDGDSLTQVSEHAAVLVPVTEMAVAADVGESRSFSELQSDCAPLIEFVCLCEGLDSGFEAVLKEVPGASAPERRHSDDVDGRFIVDHDLHSESREQAG